jgi:hypothetical protein
MNDEDWFFIGFDSNGNPAHGEGWFQESIVNLMRQQTSSPNIGFIIEVLYESDLMFIRLVDGSLQMYIHKELMS